MFQVIRMSEQDCDLRGRGHDGKGQSHQTSMRFRPLLQENFTDWTSINFYSVPRIIDLEAKTTRCNNADNHFDHKRESISHLMKAS